MTGSAQRHVERVMGTAVSFDVRSCVEPDAVRRAVSWLHWVDRTFSTYRQDSEISRIAEGLLPLDEACREVQEVLARCDDLKMTTNGWFDHRPTEFGRPLIDPSGYVKGWSLTRAAAILVEAGASDFCIAAGGDVVAVGEARRGQHWRVGIRHPEDPGRVAAVVAMPAGAIATSGRYERGDHIWSRRPDPSIGVVSATVTGPDLGVADALATAVMASGGWDIEWLNAFDGYHLLVIDSRFRVLRSPSIELVAA